MDVWHVEPELNRITGPEAVHQLEPKVMQVLLVLAGQAGRVVSREQLLGAVWPGYDASEDLLTRCISELRKAFGDDPREPSFIETIRKRGYRLIAPVTRREAEEALSQVPSEARVPLHRSRIRFSWTLALVAASCLLLGLVLYRFFFTPPDAPAEAAPAFPLTAFPGTERDPALSPDGARIAFVWNPDAGSNYDLYVRPIGTEQTLRLTDTPAREESPAWSPDGRRIAFIRRSARGCGIYVMPASGGDAQQLTPCAPSLHRGLAWSPDGRWLALSERDSTQAPFRIVLFSLDEHVRVPLSNPPIHYNGDRAPTFSPDGRRLAFIRDVNVSASMLFLLPVQGGVEEQLTPGQHALSGVAFAPDGEHLVFSADLGGNFNLWRLPIAGGPPTWIDVAGGQLRRPTAARQGTRLAYESWSQAVSVWRLDLDSTRATEPVHLADPSIWNAQPRFSPDGQRIAFTSLRSGHFELWVADRDGSDAVQLTHFEGPFLGALSWSPNGRSLVFEARPEGYADLFTVDVDEKAPRRLTQDTANQLMPLWSRDGAWIYFTSDQNGSWQIWKQPAAGGEAVQVTQHGGFGAAESPDGTVLYYAKSDQDGLWSIPLADGVERQVFAGLSHPFLRSWTLAPDGIYFARMAEADGIEIAFYCFEDQSTRPVVPLPSPEGYPDLDVSPGGDVLLFTQTERHESDLMLVPALP